MGDRGRPEEGLDEELGIEGAARRSWGGRLLALACVVVLIGAVGMIGELSGVGWFNHRPMRFGEGELYVLNMHERPVRLSVDGREWVEVPAQNAQLVELIGGTSKVVVEREGAEPRAFDVTIDHEHALLNLGGVKCLAGVDIQPYYGGTNPDDVEIVEKIPADREVVTLGTNNVVWPRKPFPPKLSPQKGRGLWVELVGCPTLAEDEESFLKGYLNFRLRERMDRAKGGAPSS